MGDRNDERTGTELGIGDTNAFLRAFGERFADAVASDRTKMLASLLSELSAVVERGAGTENGRDDPRIREMAERIRVLGEERAGLELKLKQFAVDLEQKESSLVGEQRRASQLQEIIDDLNKSVTEQARERDTIAARATELAAELASVKDRADSLDANLTSKLADSQNMERIRQLENERSALADQIRELKGRYAEIRKEKDGEIVALREKVQKNDRESAVGEKDTMKHLWLRHVSKAEWMASAKETPPEKGIAAGLEAFLALAGVLMKLEKQVYLLLREPARLNHDLNERLKAFQNREPIEKLLASALMRPSGPRLTARFVLLERFVLAAISAGDAAVRSIEKELDHRIKTSGEGLRDDPRKMLRAYQRESGPALFGQHMREYHAGRVEEMYRTLATGRR